MFSAVSGSKLSDAAALSLPDAFASESNCVPSIRECLPHLGESDTDYDDSYLPRNLVMKSQMCLRCVERHSIHSHTIKNLVATQKRFELAKKNILRENTQLKRSNNNLSRQNQRHISTVELLREKMREACRLNKRLERKINKISRKESKFRVDSLVSESEMINIKRQKDYHVKINQTLKERYKKKLKINESKKRTKTITDSSSSYI